MTAPLTHDEDAASALEDVLRKHMAPGRSDDEVAELAMRELGLDAPLRETLSPAVAFFVGSMVGRPPRAVRRAREPEPTFTPGDGRMPAHLPTVAPMSLEQLTRFCGDEAVAREWLRQHYRGRGGGVAGGDLGD